MARKVGFGANRNRKPAERVVGWGKYRGMKMRDVPTDYLEWFVKNAYGQMYARKAWAKEELERRKKRNERITNETAHIRTDERASN
jgi:hypothetical protein